MNNNYKWYKLDTAANMFASIQKKDTSRIFRNSFVLKDEEVKPEILKQAVADVIKRFPYLNVRYKAGFFWAYLEHTNIPPYVGEETEAPATVHWLGKDGGPEFRVLYYKRRITLEFAHMIADGTGAFEFSKVLIARYLNLSQNTDYTYEGIVDISSEISEDESENAYGKYFTENTKVNIETQNTYCFPEPVNTAYVKAVHGIMPVSQLKSASEKLNLTITEYLAAAAILSVIRNSKEPVNSFIRISVPINLRQFFPTKTMKNFACDTTLSFNPKGRKDVTLNEIANEIRGVIKKNITKEYLQGFINSTHGKVVNPVLRAVPYFIKKPVLNKTQFKTHRSDMTLIISNIGNITLPSWMSDRIERIDGENGNGAVYGLNIISSCVSLNGYLNFCFSQCHKDTSFCKEFFRIISGAGIDVRVETSDENGYDENERNENGKRCKHCNIDLGEEYTICPLCGEKTVNDKKHIDSFRTSEYPLTFTKTPERELEITKKPLSKEKIKAYFHI